MAEIIKNGPSEPVEPISWEQFEEEIKREQEFTEKLKLEKPGAKIFPPLFRGQDKASYFLASTLERYLSDHLKEGSWDESNDVKWDMKKEYSWENYHNILQKVKPAILSLTSNKFEPVDFPSKIQTRQPPPDYEFMIYLRHHGFPSPLLDWTISPYVAAFFAFNKLAKEENVAIFSYRESTGSGMAWRQNQPHINALGPYVRAHKRHYQQRCEYTICIKEPSLNSRIYCSYKDVKFGREQDVLKKYIIPSNERRTALAKLDLMNINAFTLFGSEDSLVETLAYREIKI